MSFLKRNDDDVESTLGQGSWSTSCRAWRVTCRRRRPAGFWCTPTTRTSTTGHASAPTFIRRTSRAFRASSPSAAASSAERYAPLLPCYCYRFNGLVGVYHTSWLMIFSDYVGLRCWLAFLVLFSVAGVHEQDAIQEVAAEPDAGADRGQDHEADPPVVARQDHDAAARTGAHPHRVAVAAPAQAPDPHHPEEARTATHRKPRLRPEKENQSTQWQLIAIDVLLIDVAHRIGGARSYPNLALILFFGRKTLNLRLIFDSQEFAAVYLPEPEISNWSARSSSFLFFWRIISNFSGFFYRNISNHQ